MNRMHDNKAPLEYMPKKKNSSAQAYNFKETNIAVSSTDLIFQFT